ncbi:hypothetical protein D910_10209 [Dendroctonus ponderosae]
MDDQRFPCHALFYETQLCQSQATADNSNRRQTGAGKVNYVHSLLFLNEKNQINRCVLCEKLACLQPMKTQTGMVSSDNSIQQEAVGSRIESGGFIGTVRFVGLLPEHAGQWYGIEWDNPSRGKHNGTVNGVQFFQTGHPTAGSFVRREKLNFGRTLIEAIAAQYGNEESDIAKRIHEQQIISLQRSINAPFIEFVGFDKVSSKQGKFESLKMISARAQHVSSLGDPSQLNTLFQNIQQLDLSKNLLNSWQTVFDVCRQLDQLFWLNVNANLLTFPEEPPPVFPKITILICGYMRLTWQDIKRLSLIFPNINELRANDNNITHLDTDSRHFKNLEILDLEHNPIGQWQEVMKLNTIKGLQELNIGGIRLERIDFGTAQAKADCFPNLTKLCLSNNLINDWTSVSELNRLPNLEGLRFSNNPILTSENPDTVIALVVAKIASLKVHNGRNLIGDLRISGEFRRGCEYDYLKKYGLEWLRVKNTPKETDFLKEHNRYLDLVHSEYHFCLYGELEHAELKIEDNSKLKNSLIGLNLVHKGREVSKKVSPFMLVQKLRILVQKLFKLEDLPALVCLEENQFEIPLDDETKELDYYCVKDNDRVFVNI